MAVAWFIALDSVSIALTVFFRTFAFFAVTAYLPLFLHRNVPLVEVSVPAVGASALWPTNFAIFKTYAVLFSAISVYAVTAKTFVKFVLIWGNLNGRRWDYRRFWCLLILTVIVDERLWNLNHRVKHGIRLETLLQHSEVLILTYWGLVIRKRWLIIKGKHLNKKILCLIYPSVLNRSFDYLSKKFKIQIS